MLSPMSASYASMVGFEPAECVSRAATWEMAKAAMTASEVAVLSITLEIGRLFCGVLLLCGGVGTVRIAVVVLLFVL